MRAGAAAMRWSCCATAEGCWPGARRPSEPAACSPGCVYVHTACPSGSERPGRGGALGNSSGDRQATPGYAAPGKLPQSSGDWSGAVSPFAKSSRMVRCVMHIDQASPAACDAFPPPRRRRQLSTHVRWAAFAHLVSVYTVCAEARHTTLQQQHRHREREGAQQTVSHTPPCIRPHTPRSAMKGGDWAGGCAAARRAQRRAR